MKTPIATGHEQNVTNLRVMISRLSTMGSAYNPSIESLSLSALQNLCNDGTNVINKLNEAEIQLQTVSASKTGSKSNFDTLITRSANAFRICGVSSVILEQGESLIRDLRGKRAGQKLTKEELAAEKEKGNEIRQVILHRTTYNRKIESLNKYILFLSNIPQYCPNEWDISAEGLSEYLTELNGKHNEWVNAATNSTVSRQERDKSLYTANTGLVDRANAAKKYVKSAFGATSPQYKLISDLKFINYGV